MKTLEQTFIADVWEETGEMGFRPERCSNAFDPINVPFGLAHDFIEHAGNFTVEGEIMAHGAMFLVRYETGYTTPDQWRAMDLESIALEWSNLYQGIQVEGCLDSCPSQPRLDERVEEELAEIVSMGKRHLLEEIGKEFLDTHVYAALSQHFADWFRKGYTEATERYADICAATAFEEVRQHFEQALKDELVGGESVRVSLDLSSGEVKFNLARPCYECYNGFSEDGSGLCEDCQEANQE